MIWDDVKDADTLSDAIETYIKTEISDFDKIRTKKVVMYSNLIASTINLAVCIGGGIISAKAGNAELSKEFWSHLDVGGAIVTIATLFKDGRYISKVKDDFIKKAINGDFKKRMEEIEKLTSCC